jgi:hypothetical protein
MPNTVAYIALLVWPMVSVVFFRTLRAERAIICTILGGYLLLPQVAAFDLPMMPALDKVAIPNLAALLGCVVILGKRVSLLPESRVARILMILFVASPLLTVLTNRDPIPFADGGIPALRIYDSVAAIVNQTIFLLPFFLGRQFLATETAQRDILWLLVIAGLFYSIPMLIEVRLSPQLHVWIYGFFQHDFIQMMRQDGFRPIVFLYHGLWVAFFTMTTLLAAVALWRTSLPGKRTPFVFASGYFAVMLVLCKSLGSLGYGLVFAPIVRFASQKAQIRLAVLLAMIALCYPLLRGGGLIPVETMVDFAASIEQDRADSLLYRFDNENVLLDHASEKPLFGWGMWGRNQVYDPIDGKMLTVTDGRWIIVIGVYGWLGYIIEFGLLTLPLLLLNRGVRRLPPEVVSPYVGPLALMLAINMIDLLPNATLIPFTWLLVGGLLGHVEMLKAERRAINGKAPILPTHRSDARGSPAFPESRTII